MKRLVQPTAWRWMLVAFALWAANFLVGYAAVLVAPEALATRILLGAMAVASVARKTPPSGAYPDKTVALVPPSDA